MSPLVQERLAALWLRDYGQVRNYVQGRLHSPELAEDITMQAFAQLGEMLVNSPGSVDRIAQGRLLQTLAERRIVDHIRVSVFRGPHFSYEETIDAEQFRDFDVDHLDFAASFDGIVRALPEPERDAFILTALRGLTLRQAADVLGTSHFTVGQRAASATTLIREELAA